MATSGRSPGNAVVEDIPLQDRPSGSSSISHPRIDPLNGEEPPKPEESPPPYSASAAPPGYERHPPPAQQGGPNGPAVPKTKFQQFRTRYRKWITVAAVLCVVFLAATLGRVLSNRTKDGGGSTNTPIPAPHIYDPTNITDAKIFGLASAECEQGTFVVWKLQKGEFWFTGRLLNGEWMAGDAGRIAPMKVPAELGPGQYDFAPPPIGTVNMTAVCYAGQFEDDEVDLSFIYQHPNRDFKQTTLRLRYIRGANQTSVRNSSILSAFYDTIEGVPFYPVALTSAYMTSPTLFAGHHLFYALPNSNDNPDTSDADIIHRVQTLSQWGMPSNIKLNLTTLNFKSGIAAATIDGKDRDDSATSLHLVFHDDSGAFVTVNWTEKGEWSETTQLLSPELGDQIKPPFKLCLPSSNHTAFQLTPSNISNTATTPDSELYQQPLTTSLQYFVSWVSHQNASIHYLAPNIPPSNHSAVNGIQIFPYTPKEATAPLTYSVGSVTAPRLISCSARRYVGPVEGSKAYTDFWNEALNGTNTDAQGRVRGSNATLVNGDGKLLLSVEGRRESTRWSERVQLFFVDALHGEGSSVMNMTWRRDRTLSGPRWTSEDVTADIDLDY